MLNSLHKASYCGKHLNVENEFFRTWKIEDLGAATGWVSPLSAEDKEFIKYFRSVFKRYNINPSKATRLEYDFVTRVAESEFYLQQANA